MKTAKKELFLVWCAALDSMSNDFKEDGLLNEKAYEAYQEATLNRALQALYSLYKDRRPVPIAMDKIQLIPPGNQSDYSLYCSGFNRCLEEVDKIMADIFGGEG